MSARVVLKRSWTAVVAAVIAGTLWSVAGAAYGAVPRLQMGVTGDSWLGYLNTYVGRSCTTGFDDKATHTAVKQTLTLLSMSNASVGTVLRYRSNIESSSRGSPSTHSTMIYPYVVLKNGDLGTEPGLGSLGGGFRWSYKGYEVFPPLSSLRSPSRSLVSGLTVVLSATTPAARRELQQMVTSGNRLLIRFSIRVSGLPPVARLTTPHGTFTDVIGVRVSLFGIKALNASKSFASAFTASSAFGKALSRVTLYFAKGVGIVSADVGGVRLLYDGCTGGS